MPNILKSSAKTHAAKSFLQSFYDAGGNDRIFMGLGDAGGEWGTPSSPDVPLDTYEEEKNFWANLIGTGEVNQNSNTDMIVPRKTWESGVTYAVFDETVDTGSGSFDSVDGRDFYVSNTELAPKVYKLLSTTGNPANSEPTHTNPNGVDDGSGNVWGYMYSIGGGGDVSATLLTTNWMPVPSSAQSYTNGLATSLGDLCMGDGTGSFDSNQIYQVSATTGNANGADMNSDTNNTWVPWYGDFELGCFYVGCSLAFPDYDGTGGVALNGINNVPYRQVALLRNPLDDTGARITEQWKGSGFLASANLSMGVVLTLDNRVTITRAVGQTETVRLILEF